jgi:diaminohydroxyphosphoribosylaminopyrimidine deaminase/5-amino-6-(5-phosphoribosylamino)uracil reductase
MGDPFPQVNGRGFAMLRSHGIVVDVGIEHDAAVRLNQPFLTAVREGRPFVILKAATSLDGRIARKGERTPLTSAPALRHAQYMRAQVDAIAAGSETILVDEPLLTAREVYRERPLTRVIFDRRGRVPPTARIFSTLSAGPVLVVTSSELGDAIKSLAAQGIQSLILEGGAAVHAAAWDAGVVDYVQLYVAPVWLGQDGVPLLEGRDFSPAALVESSVEQIGPDVLIEGYVHRPH